VLKIAVSAKKVQRPPTLSAKTLTAIYNQNRPTHHHMLHALTAEHPPQNSTILDLKLIFYCQKGD